MVARGLAHFSIVPLLLVAASAHAQNAGNQAAAEALFDQGKVAMAAKRYAEACPKFVESNRLDEGIGTSLWLADCYEKNGQTASAWAQFREAAALAVKSGDPREKVARARAQALEERLARLVLIVPLASRLPGLRLARDGGQVNVALWGASVPTDPGQHTVVASAPDHLTQTMTIDVLQGPGEQALLVPALVEAPTPSAPAANDVVRSDGDRSPGGRPIQRTAAVASIAAGVVTVGVASYFGLHAKAELDDSNGAGGCVDNRCNQHGVTERATAGSSATASTVLFVVGGALLSGGAVLWLTTPARRPPPGSRGASTPVRLRAVPWLDPHGGGVVVGADL